MKNKKILAVLAALLLTFSFAIPAYAAGLNSNEEAVFNEFVGVLNYWSGERGILDAAHVNQYRTEAETALNQVDLSATACQEFSQALKRVDQLFKDNNVQTRGEMYALYGQAASIVNEVGSKYGITVSVDPSDKEATVRVSSPALANAGGAVVANTGPVVRQSGLDLAPTAGAILSCAVALVAVVVLARRQRLFV